ncbi:hypothetical protein TWF730_011192 [Orbilia blumenaviensis]|uniref:NACHT domain-containing protein n=1 Tax=Orbilia blumenaviensis TaxID=1796055 RepID=A0AAV9UJN0_9PEZI
MSGLTAQSFQASLDKFQKRLSKENKRRFPQTSLEGVKLEMKEIQKRLGPEKNLRNFNRLKKFLEGMKQVEQLVQVFLNCSEVVAYVWGPIKLALMMVSTKVENLDRLLGVYEEIGEVIHGVGKYDRLFRNYPDIRRILEMYFYDILEFHHEVLELFSKSNWTRMLSYAWPTFKTRFDPIIDSLKRHRDLLSDEKITAILEESQQNNRVIETIPTGFQEIITKLDQLQKDIDDKKLQAHEHKIKRKEILKTKLHPPNYHQHQLLASKKRSAPSSGNWVFQDPKFKAWLGGDLIMDSILYINGIPGSGKTTLLSKIITSLLSDSATNGSIVLYFYFKHDDKFGKTKDAMLLAILMQLAEQDDVLLEYIYQKCAGLAESEILQELFLQGMLTHCFEKCGKVRIVLDALDEAEEAEKDIEDMRPVIAWLKEQASPAVSRGYQLRLLVSGQRDGHIDEALSEYPAINLDKAARHKTDIMDYAYSRALNIQARFKLGPDEYSDIICKVAEFANGMFLYVKVVLDNLLEQRSVAKFRKELNQENFPKGLNQAYERVALRIFDEAHESKSSAAVNILGWIVTSGRPLRWREIQARFCIDPEDAICDPEERLEDSCKILCSSLVDFEPCCDHKDTESEQVVSIVHPTASSYLIQTGRLKVFKEHAQAAIYFSQYLLSHPFESHLVDTEIRDQAVGGYYALHDYACAFWYHHFRSALSTPSDISNNLIDSVIRYAEPLISLFQPASQLPSIEGQDRIGTFAQNDVLSKVNECWELGVQESKLAQQVTRIRAIIESIVQNDLDNAQDEVFYGLHGVLRYKCPNPKCILFANGFSSSEKRDHHIREHERPFKCPTPGCYAQTVGFSSSKILDHHIRRLHSRSDRVSLFPKGREPGPYDIYKAAMRGDIEAVKRFRRKGVPLERVKNNNKNTPLLLAARHNHLLVCEYLVREGSNPYYSMDCFPIGEAIKNNDIPLFDLLRSLSTHKCPPYSESRMMEIAIAYDAEDMVQEISKHWGPFEVRNIEGAALHTFSRKAQLQRLDTDIFARQKRALHKLIAKSNPYFYESDQETLKKSFPSDMSLFIETITKDWDRLSQYSAGKEVSYAITDVLLDITDTLRNCGCNTVSLVNRALARLAATCEKSNEKMKAYKRNLVFRAIPNANANEMVGSSLLIYLAARSGELILVEPLIPLTQDIDQKDHNSPFTPLSAAAGQLHIEVVKILVESGRVNLEQESSRDTTVLLFKNGKIYINPAVVRSDRRKDIKDEPICDDPRKLSL